MSLSLNNEPLFIYCLTFLQIRLKPPMGSSDATFRRRWDDIIREAEAKLLTAQREWISSQRSTYEALSRETMAALKERVQDPEVFKDAESAVNTVACRVRTDTLTTEKKKYALAVENYEAEHLEVDRRRQNKKSRPQKEPQAGPSNAPNKRPPNPQGRRQGPKGGKKTTSKNQQKALNTLLSLFR